MNDDTAELQARIAALRGQINKHKQQPAHFVPHQPPNHRGANRWTPYSHVDYGNTAATFKNRTLILGGTQSAKSSHPRPEETYPEPQDSFVSSRRPGTSQLMTKDVYAREQALKLKLEEKKQAARSGPLAWQKNVKPSAHNNSTAQPPREMTLEGIRFQVRDDGSKLVRVVEASTAPQETPKKVEISGVTFLRTKHGNLIRATGPKDTTRYRSKDAIRDPGQNSRLLCSRRRTGAQPPQCENFTKHGTCAFGPTCRFTHDPTKVAMCREFLRNGSCKAGRTCDLSHEPTYHRVSACTHFLRGNCTNSACRYPHVNVSLTAPICRAFATLGFCAKGPGCDNRHVIECPDYANHGHCAGREKGVCQLPHIDRAGALRKAAERQAKTGSEDDSDLSSDEETVSDQDMDDGDSDIAEEDVAIVIGSDEEEEGDVDDDRSHALSQQRDYVSFS